MDERRCERMEELTEMILRGWEDVPGDRIPKNWRYVSGPGGTWRDRMLNPRRRKEHHERRAA